MQDFIVERLYGDELERLGVELFQLEVLLLSLSMGVGVDQQLERR